MTVLLRIATLIPAPNAVPAHVPTSEPAVELWPMRVEQLFRDNNMTSEYTPEQLRSQADELLNANRIADARAIYEKLCQLNDNDAHAWLMIGAIDGDMGKVDQAILHVRKAIASDENYTEAYHALARILASQGNVEEARDSLEQAITLDPQCIEALVMLAGIHVQLHNYSEAESYCRMALQQNNAIVDTYIILGDALLSQEKYREAIISYQTLTQLQPALQIAWSRLGTAQLQLKDISAAEISLDKALLLNPDDLNATMHLAWIHVAKGQFNAAVNRLNIILKSHAENELALRDARLICEKIPAGNPALFDALLLFGQIELRSGKAFLAVKLMERAIRLRPNSSIAHLTLGSALRGQGKLTEAVSAYRRAIDLQSDLREAQQLLESTIHEIKFLDEAIMSLEKSNQGPAIRFTDEERAKSIPNLTTLNLAGKLYEHFGYLIIEDVFSEQYISTLHDHFMTEYSKYLQDADFDDALKVGNKRTMATIKLEGPFNDPEYYANPLLMPLLSRILGQNFILLSLGSVSSLPGALPQNNHRDHDPLFDDDAVNALIPSFAITLGIPLIEMNEVNGTTRVYGKTHRKQSARSDEDNNRGINPVIRKGSCLLFDYRLLHEGTQNNSMNVRPLMYNIYSRPWFRDGLNYSKQRPLVVTDDEYEKVPDNFRHLFSWSRRFL